MFKSDSIAALADALSKAQDEMKNAVKDSSNPFFKSKYADLASVTDACRHELAKNGLAVVQLPSVRDGKVVLEYCLLHASGEFIGSELEMTPVKNDPQGIGSAITYARRYSLAGITGVATEDDDGNAASGNTESARKARVTTEDIEIKPKAAATSGATTGRYVVSGVARNLTREEAKALGFKESAAVGTVSAPSPSGVSSQEGTPLAAEIPIPGDGCIGAGEAANFYKMFRDSLKPVLRKQAEDLAHDFLRAEKILDVTGKPSALAIKKEYFFEVREKGIAHARSL